MSDDLGEQSKDLDKRIAAAGSTDKLMQGLVRSVRTTRTILIVAVCGLVLDLALSVGLGIGLVNLHQTDNKANDNNRIVETNSERICAQANRFANAHNDLIDALLAALANGTGLPPAEREARAARYAATRVPIIKC